MSGVPKSLKVTGTYRSGQTTIIYRSCAKWKLIITLSFKILKTFKIVIANIKPGIRSFSACGSVWLNAWVTCPWSGLVCGSLTALLFGTIPVKPTLCHSALLSLRPGLLEVYIGLSAAQCYFCLGLFVRSPLYSKHPAQPLTMGSSWWIAGGRGVGEWWITVVASSLPHWWFWFRLHLNRRPVLVPLSFMLYCTDLAHVSSSQREGFFLVKAFHILVLLSLFLYSVILKCI